MTTRVVAIVLAVALAAALVFGGVAEARPGGGESYSGGGGHSSSGGSSGGGGDGAFVFELVFQLFRLCFYYPAVGLPLLCIVTGYVVYRLYRVRQALDWDSGPPVVLEHGTDLTDLRQHDPAFSQIVFEDFAFRLFSTVHRARHSAEALAALAPYVSPTVQNALAHRAPAGEPVVQAIVGAMRPYRVVIPDREVGANGHPAQAVISLEFEANVATAEHTYYSVERWDLSRAASARSKPPGAARTFGCPNCGAPWAAAQSGTQVCASCNQAVDNGRFDWVVTRIELLSNREQPPTLTTEVPERGTQLPTYRDPGVDAAWQKLSREDPALTEPALLARMSMIYDQLNRAWSNNDLRPVRGLVSDGLYDYLSYWVEAYRRQALRNVLTDMRITHATLAKLERDPYFYAITMRIWGTGVDYVIREPSGDHVRGSRRRPRAYSEYWTLIRTATRKGPAVTTPACSHCGAPLQVAASGECEYCGVHVSGGEFDWTLSKIEQDDSYRG